jgi:hypothetical protein
VAPSSFDLSAPAGPTAATGRPPTPIEAPLDAFALLRDQVRGTFAFNRTSLAGHLVGAVLIVLILAGAVPRPLLCGWSALFLLVWLLRLSLALRYARREPTTEKRLLARLRTWQVGVLVGGSLWGRPRGCSFPTARARSRSPWCWSSTPSASPACRSWRRSSRCSWSS